MASEAFDTQAARRPGGRKPVPWLVVLIGGALASVVGFYLGSLRPEATVAFVEGTPTEVQISWFRAPLGRSGLPDEVITVNDKNEIGKLSVQLNSLHPIRAGATINCAYDDGSNYQMVFLYGNGDRLTIRVDAKGCQDVSAFGVVKASAANAGVLTELRRLIPSSA
jgi:hypothetical protein